ncbi:hypothetical protein ACP70R_036701 [Stipagrostis hirtigluma subsp. patula]
MATVQVTWVSLASSAPASPAPSSSATAASTRSSARSRRYWTKGARVAERLVVVVLP